MYTHTHIYICIYIYIYILQTGTSHKFRKQTGTCQRGVGKRRRRTGEREVRGISFQLQNKWVMGMKWTVWK